MNIKSLILGSAAAVFAVGSAQAADLPVAEPVDYVQICDAYGAGYFFIPGTDTCLKINGEVLLKVHTNGFRSNVSRSGVGGGRSNAHLFDMDTEMNITFTAREETEMGTLTAVIELDDLADGGIGNGAAVDKAYLQLGGFYAGLTDSLIEFNGGQAYDDFSTSHGDLNAIGYHADMGNGVTASIALEEFGVYPAVGTGVFRDVVDTDNNGIPSAGDTYTNQRVAQAGRSAPAIAAAIAVDQAWGSVAVGASAFQVRYVNAAFSTDIGYTIGGDASFKVADPLTFTLGAGYSMGARAPAGAVAAVAGTLNSQWEVSAGLVYAFADNFDFKLGAGYLKFNDRTVTNNDQKIWGVSAGAAYNPVKNLEIAGKVGYQKVDFRNAGSTDWDDVAAELTIKRSF